MTMMKTILRRGLFPALWRWAWRPRLRWWLASACRRGQRRPKAYVSDNIQKGLDILNNKALSVRAAARPVRDASCWA